MNHAGEIEPLTRMVRPHVAIVTTVEPVHLEYFENVEGDRPRQGRDLPRPRAGRRGDHQPRQSALRRCSPSWPAPPASSASSASASTRRPRRGSMRSALTRDRLLRRRHRLRRAGRLQARRARPPSRPEQPGGARRRVAARRRPGAGGAGARRACRRQGPRRSASELERAGRHGDADRRELQRQSGLDARGDRAARPDRARRATAGASPSSATCWNSGDGAEAMHAGARRRRWPRPMSTPSSWSGR